MALKLYTNPQSRGIIARWMLEEIGQPYEVENLSYGEGMKSAEYLQMNPMGKVPTVVHDGKVITEVAAICAYLAEAFPEAGLAPLPEERADYYRWMFFTAGPFEAAITDRNYGFNPDENQKRSVGYGDYETTLETMVQAVSKPAFICGDTFRAVDVVVGAQLSFALMFGMVPKHPTLEAYVARIASRPAFLKASADSQAEAEAMKV